MGFWSVFCLFVLFCFYTMTIHGISVLTYDLLDFKVVHEYRHTAAHHVTI